MNIKKKYGEKKARAFERRFGLNISDPDIDKIFDQGFDENTYQSSFWDSGIGNNESSTSLSPLSEIEEAVNGKFIYLKTFSDVENIKHLFSDHPPCGFNQQNLWDTHHCFIFISNEDPEPENNYHDSYNRSRFFFRIRKSTGVCSDIVCRYNHHVGGDANGLFNRNLNYFHEGLTQSLSKHFNITISQSKNVENINGYIFKDNYFYKIEYIEDHTSVLSKNGEWFSFKNNQDIIKIPFNKDFTQFCNGFFIDFKNKTVSNCRGEVLEYNQNGVFVAKSEDDYLKAKSKNKSCIFNTRLLLNNIQSIGNDFLCYNKTLTSIELPNIQSIGNGFLYYNKTLTSIELPNIQSIGNDFLCYNETLTFYKLSQK